MPTILVVDDEPLIRQVVALMLQQEGYSVLTASGGAEALSLTRAYEGAIDMLVSDVAMPGMDGPTLASELLEANPKLPVLFISASTDRTRLDGCRRFRLLLKPFSSATLRGAVQGLLPSGTWESCGQAQPAARS